MLIRTVSNKIKTNFLYCLIQKIFHHSFWNIFITDKLILIFYKQTIKVSRFCNSWLDLLLFGLIAGYKIYLELKGTGYKMRLVADSLMFGIIFRLGYSHLIYIKLSQHFRAFFFNKSILGLYTNDIWLLNRQANQIFLQKKINIYKGKGVFSKNSIIKLKKSTKLRF